MPGLKSSNGSRRALPVLALVAALALTGLLAGCRSSSRTAEAEAPAPQEESAALQDAIVFVRDSDVWFIKPDGTGETRLTASPEPKSYPRLSPDGRSVAFTSYLGGEDNPAGASVKMVSLGGSGSERSVTTLARGFAPAFLEDGRIAFLRTGTREEGSVTWTWDDIYVMAADGGDESRLTDYSAVSDSGGGLRIFYLCPSPDGREIAFVRGRRSDTRWVATVTVDGLETRFLTSPPLEPNSSGRGLADGSIAMASPDEIYLSHGSLNKVGSQSGQHLFLLDLAGGNETLLSSGSDDRNPTLSPGKSHLAFEASGSIFTSKDSGLGPEVLTRGSMPCWGRSIKLASEGPASSGRIAFVRDCNIWVSGPDHGGERRLTSEAEPPRDAQPGTYSYVDWGGLAFSPGGGRLAAWKVGSDIAPALVLVDVSSGALTDLGQEFRAAWESAGMFPWLGDISWASEDALYCTAGTVSSVLGEVHVVRLDLASGALTDVAAWAKDPAVSPDGRYLAYVSAPPESQGDEVPWGNSSPGNLVILDLESGLKTTVSSDVIEAVFTPAGDSLVAVCRNDPDTDLRLMDLEGNTVTRLDTVGPTFIMGHPSVSPDGGRAVYYVGDNAGFGVPTTDSLIVVELGGGSFTAQTWGKGRYPSWR